MVLKAFSLSGFGTACRGALLTGALMGTMVVTLTACSSSDPSLYVLTPVAGAPAQATPGVLALSTPLPAVVEVRKPTIAGALDRDRIVLDDSGHKLVLSKTDAWSAPLSAQIPHVLAKDLAQRLPGVNLFVQDDATAADPEVYVEMVVNRFARDSSGDVVLDAQVAVHRAGGEGGARNRPILLRTTGSSGTDGMVAALSTLLGQAADQIAAEIRALPPVPPETP